MSETPPGYAQHLSGLLSGRRHKVHESQWHERILEGLPVEAIENLKTAAAMTDTEIVGLLGIGEATLRRARAAGGLLDSWTSDRLFRVSKVIALALEVLGSGANAMSWLRRPQPGLNDQIPLDLLVTQAGTDEVETLLRRIDYGVYT